MAATPVLEEWEEPGPEGGPEPGSSILIRDLQTKLNDARSAGAGDGAKSTGERPWTICFARGVLVTGGKERCLQTGSKKVT